MSSREAFLSADEEKRLIANWQNEKDQRALDRIVNAYSPLCKKLTRAAAEKYGSSATNDLLQEARLGLIQAIEKFSLDKDVRLATYAYFWINERLRAFAVEDNWIVRVPRNTRHAVTDIYNEERTAHHGQTPDAETVVDRARQERGMDPRMARVTFNMIAHGKAFSLDAPMGNDPDGDLTGQDLLIDRTSNPEREVHDQLQRDRRHQDLYEALATLSPRRSRVLHARRLTDEPVTLESLSQELGVSKERVRQIELDAIRDISARLNAAT